MIRSECGFILSWTHTRGEQYNFKGEREGEGFSDSCVTTNQIHAIFHPSLRTQPTFPEAITGFLAKWRLGNERGNSILMTMMMSLPGSGQWIWLAEARFPRGTANRKHYSDLGSEASSVWNFCSRSSEVISPETSGGVAKFGFFLRYFSSMKGDQHALKKWQKKLRTSCGQLLLRSNLKVPVADSFSREHRYHCHLLWNSHRYQET